MDGYWTNNTSPIRKFQLPDMAALKAHMARFERLKEEADSKVFVFDGPLAKFEAELALQSPPPSAFVADPDGGPPAFPLSFFGDGLEVIEFDGSTYIGTRAGLRLALLLLGQESGPGPAPGNT